jgi:hypothetical protein
MADDMADDGSVALKENLIYASFSGNCAASVLISTFMYL